jgi:hypothetical protein
MAQIFHNEKNKSITFRLDEDIKEQIMCLTLKKYVSTAALLRDFIRHNLSEEKRKAFLQEDKKKSRTLARERTFKARMNTP